MENKLASLFVVSLGKALSGISPLEWHSDGGQLIRSSLSRDKTISMALNTKKILSSNILVSFQTDLNNELEEIEQNKTHQGPNAPRPSSAHSKGAVSHVSHDSLTESEDDDDDFDDRRTRMKNMVAKDDFLV